jgi:hypothetical protein
LADFDGNGRFDLISGSWPGEISIFRRNGDGSFAGAETMQNEKGEPLNLGHGSSAFACDWLGDGRMGLIVGTSMGEVFFVPRAPGKELRFGPAKKLTLADGKPLLVNGSASPVVADWDGDGKLDLIVGAMDGSVVWFRNIGTKREPKLEAARELVPKCPTPRGYDPKPGEWGERAKPCVIDWNGNGRLDLLVGDTNGHFKGKPTQLTDEKTEEKQANDDLPKLRKAWSDAFKQYRAAGVTPERETPEQLKERKERLDSLRRDVERLKNEIAHVQEVQEKYRDGYQTHGFIWLFMRNPPEKK